MPWENGACRYSATMGKSGMDRQRGKRVSNEREESEAQGGNAEKKTQHLGPWVETLRSDHNLSGGLVLGWHATADRHGVLAALLLLLLKVLVVGHLLLLLIGHVARVHARAHVTLRRVDAVSHVLGSLGRDIGRVNTVLIGGGVGSIQTGLNEVLALGLGHEGLELRGGEGVDEAGFGDDQKKDLSSGENGKLVGLLHDTSLALREGDVTTRLILNELDLDLATLTARLVIIIVLVVGAHTVALGAPAVITGKVIMTRRQLFIDSRHDGKEKVVKRDRMW